MSEEIKSHLFAIRTTGGQEKVVMRLLEARMNMDHDEVMVEMLLSMKRAGADIIISYFAKDIAKILRDSHGIR